MNTFLNALENEENVSYTTNGAETFKSSKNKCLDLFFIIGSSRNAEIIDTFKSALQEDEDLAIRILLWSRDIRGGAGERENFRKVLKFLDINHPEILSKIIPIIPELGRWDDLFEIESLENRQSVFAFLESNLDNSNVSLLLKKWLPRPKKSKFANAFRKYLNMTPKEYRKMLVEGSDTVEQKIQKKDYSSIDYSKVPSIASARYTGHFFKNDEERYRQFLDSLKSGKTKINASSIFPHDVIRGWGKSLNEAEIERMEEQWKALPFDLGNKNILPVVDVSGSMTTQISKNTSALDVSLALGLLCASKNNGAFKNYFVTFAENPEIVKIDSSKTIYHNIKDISYANWGMNTDLQKTFEKLLSMAKENNVLKQDMPSHIIILSDMEFDSCIQGGKNFDNISLQYKENGYELPKIIFWNLNGRPGNVPVKFNQEGVALISGYSAFLMQAILKGGDDTINPLNIMFNSVMNDRYEWL